MALEIFKGHDCCKDFRYPKRNIEITPRMAQVKRGESIELNIKNVHPACDESCFNWRLKSGGGRLPHTVGLTVFYWAPDENPECKNNAHIQLICGGKIRADAYILSTIPYPGTHAYRVYVKYPGMRYLPPWKEWPAPGLRPPPPQDKPPEHVKFSDDVAFPFDWKPGDSLPPGATVDIWKLIPDEWIPGQLPPDGVRIPPGTVFPPGWREKKELPAGVAVSTLTLFPPDWKAHLSSDMVQFNYPQNTYGCADDLLIDNPGPRHIWYWSYNHKAGRWQLWPPTGTALGGPYASTGAIPWGELRKDYPKVLDLRSEALRKAECCPTGLIGVAYFKEEEA